MQPNNVSLLVVDIQNDFCHDDGIFSQLGLDLKPAQKVTPRIKAFIDKVRKYDVPVIYTRQIESDKVSPENLKRQFASEKLKAVCAPNSWGSELYQLEPVEGEYVIEKHTYDAFSNPKLQEIFRERAIDTLVIVGVNTDICIDTTVRRAFTEGYNVLVPRDLVATMNVDGEKYFLDIFDKFFGDVVASSQVLEYLQR
jgi:ureidoacrylate peracid hydrolase